MTLDEEGRGTTVTLTVRLRRTPDVDPDTRCAPAGADGARRPGRGSARSSASAGAVDEPSAEQLRIRLLEASHGGTVPVELDLTGVTLFSSAAVRVVLAIARIARDEGWRLVVHAPEGGVTRHILEISGLGGLVDLR